MSPIRESISGCSGKQRLPTGWPALVDKEYPQFDCSDCDETEVGFHSLLLWDGHLPPVFELIARRSKASRFL